MKVGDPRHLELPYARVLPACLIFVQAPLRLLIDGLGGGTLPRFFHSHFPEMTIDVVELDRDVLDVATAHCGFKEDARMRVYVEDGRDFIEASRGGYDVIILDSFDTESIPTHLATLEFLSSVRKALAPKGLAVANIRGRATNPLYAHMVLTYGSAFEDVYILDIPVPGAKIFVALPHQREMTQDELIKQAREISRHREFDYDLGDAIAGFRHSEFETVRGGSVLRD